MFFVSTHDAMGSTWITGGLDSLESVLSTSRDHCIVIRQIRNRNRHPKNAASISGLRWLRDKNTADFASHVCTLNSVRNVTPFYHVVECVMKGWVNHQLSLGTLSPEIHSQQQPTLQIL